MRKPKSEMQRLLDRAKAEHKSYGQMSAEPIIRKHDERIQERLKRFERRQRH